MRWVNTETVTGISDGFLLTPLSLHPCHNTPAIVGAFHIEQSNILLKYACETSENKKAETNGLVKSLAFRYLAVGNTHLFILCIISSRVWFLFSFCFFKSEGASGRELHTFIFGKLLKNFRTWSLQNL